MLKGQAGLERTSVKAVQSCSQKLEWFGSCCGAKT